MSDCGQASCRRERCECRATMLMPCLLSVNFFPLCQLIVHSVSDVTSFTKMRFPETTGCVHVSLPATL